MAKQTHTKKMVIVSLFTSLVCATTLFPHIPTPTMGYLHLGDAMVLLSGIFLGPAYGSFAAGVGSALADAFTGYFSYVPATLIIKALTACVAGALFRKLRSFGHSSRHGFDITKLSAAGIAAELFMVSGYFVYEIFLMALTTGRITTASLSSGLLAALAGIPFNMVQGAFGVLIAAILYPIVLPLFLKSADDSQY